MRKWFIPLSLIFLLIGAGCSVSGDVYQEDANAPEKESDLISDIQAESIVREKLGLEENKDVRVEFDRMEEKSYLIHVYDVVENDEGKTQNATRGWYLVDPETKEVTDFKDSES